jgi:hypothetical protein
MQHFHAAVVGRHQRAFAAGKRDIELTPRVFAVHQQGAGKTQGHLGHPGEVLDVSPRFVRVERITGDVLQFRSGLLPDESLAGADDFIAVVIPGIAWHCSGHGTAGL